jgi:hypothetical protein
VGKDGWIIHYNGSAWSQVTTPTSSALWDVWGSSQSDVWAVGESITVLHYNGSSWSVAQNVPAMDGNLFGIRGRSASDVWAVGSYFDGKDLYPRTIRYNGSTWSQVTHPGTGAHEDVWVSPAGNVWISGYTESGLQSLALIRHYNGTSWVDQSPAGVGAVYGLWGAGECDLWGVSSELIHLSP